MTLQPPFSLRMMPPLPKRRWLYGPPLKRKILKGTTALSPCHHKPMRQRAQKLHSSGPRQSGPWVGSTRKLLIWGYLFTFSLSTSVYHLQTTKPWCQTLCGISSPFSATLDLCFYLISSNKRDSEMDGRTQKPRTPLGRARPDTRGSPLAPLSEDWTKDGSGPRAGARGQHLLCQKGQTSGWSHHEVPE